MPQACDASGSGAPARLRRDSVWTLAYVLFSSIAVKFYVHELIIIVVVVVVVFILVANYINPWQRRDYRGIWMNLLAKYFGVGLRPILAANLTAIVANDAFCPVFSSGQA